jgi:hypothetical protein
MVRRRAGAAETFASAIRWRIAAARDIEGQDNINKE